MCVCVCVFSSFLLLVVQIAHSPCVSTRIVWIDDLSLDMLYMHRDFCYYLSSSILKEIKINEKPNESKSIFSILLL